MKVQRTSFIVSEELQFLAVALKVGIRRVSCAIPCFVDRLFVEIWEYLYSDKCVVAQRWGYPTELMKAESVSHGFQPDF